MTERRAVVYASLVFAALFALISMILGFGVILSILSAIIGAISGRAFIDRSTGGLSVSSRSGMEQIFRSGYQNGGVLSRNIETPNLASVEQGGFEKLFGVLSAIFSFESRYQRVACYVFFSQAVIGLVAICLFWTAQAMGVEIDVLNNPSVERLFVDAIPLENASEVAKLRFVHLFVPLASLYAISLAVFGVAFLHSIASASRNIRKHAPVMLFIPVVVFCLWLFLFYAGSSRSGLKRLIIEGNVWGHLAFFVLTPIFYVMLAAVLPNSRAR